MKKIIAFLILIVVLVCTLSGCAEVWYSITIDDYGARTMELKVNFNSEDADYLRQKEAVTSLFIYTSENNIYASVVTPEEGDSLILRYYYPTQTDYEIAFGITGDEIGEEEAEFNDINLLYHEYVGTLNPANKISFVNYAIVYMRHYNPLFPKLFCASLKEVSSNADLSYDMHCAIQEIYLDETLETFDEYLDDDGYSEELSELAYQAMKNLDCDYSQVEVFFQYSHAFKSVYAREYDDCYEVGGQTAYVWKLDPLSNNEFTIYQKTPLVWVWEVIGIGLGVVAIAIVLVVGTIINEKNKRKEGEKPKL